MAKESTPIMTAPGTSSAEYQALFVPIDQVDNVWPECETLLVSALKYSKGEFDLDDFRKLLLQGLVQLFYISRDGDIELALITELVQYPQYRSVRILAAAGKNLARASVEFKPAFIEWAVANGAVELECWAPDNLREEFYKILGFTKAYSVLRFDLRGKLQ